MALYMALLALHVASNEDEGDAIEPRSRDVMQGDDDWDDEDDDEDDDEEEDDDEDDDEEEDWDDNDA